MHEIWRIHRNSGTPAIMNLGGSCCDRCNGSSRREKSSWKGRCNTLFYESWKWNSYGIMVFPPCQMPLTHLYSSMIFYLICLQIMAAGSGEALKKAGLVLSSNITVVLSTESP